MTGGRGHNSWFVLRETLSAGALRDARSGASRTATPDWRREPVSRRLAGGYHPAQENARARTRPRAPVASRGRARAIEPTGRARGHIGRAAWWDRGSSTPTPSSTSPRCASPASNGSARDQTRRPLSLTPRSIPPTPGPPPKNKNPPVHLVHVGGADRAVRTRPGSGTARVTSTMRCRRPRPHMHIDG